MRTSLRIVIVLIGITAFSTGFPAPGSRLALPAPDLAGHPVISPEAPAVALTLNLLLGGDLLPDLAVGRALTSDDAAGVLSGWTLLRERAGAHLGFANLESPLAESGRPLEGKRYTFRGPPVAAARLKEAGFDVVSLANNHALDFGAEALLETLEHLRRAGVAAAGAGKDEGEAYAPTVVMAAGVRVVFLAFTDTFAVPTRYRTMWGAGPDQPGTALLTDAARVRALVEDARRAADAGGTSGLVVVSTHWGYEYVRHPSSADRSLALAIVEGGADLVVGHHPHVTQGVELHQGRPIFYSLGNLLFDSEKSPNRTVAATVVLHRDAPDRPWRMTEIRLSALIMDRVRLTACSSEDPGGRAVLEEMARLSALLGTRSRFSDAGELIITAEKADTSSGP